MNKSTEVSIWVLVILCCLNAIAKFNADNILIELKQYKIDSLRSDNAYLKHLLILKENQDDSILKLIPYTRMAHENEMTPFASEEEFIKAFQDASLMDDAELQEYLKKNKAVECNGCSKKHCRGFKWEKR